MKNWAIQELIREQTFWRFTENVYKIREKKTLQSSITCPRELSFHTIPYIRIIMIVGFECYWDLEEPPNLAYWTVGNKLTSCYNRVAEKTILGLILSVFYITFWKYFNVPYFFYKVYVSLKFNKCFHLRTLDLFFSV